MKKAGGDVRGGDVGVGEVGVGYVIWASVTDRKKMGNYQKGWRKRRGEMAESEFLNKAVRMGFGVAKPWGESDRYDFVVDSGKRLWRVQIKSAHSRAKSGYRIHCSGRSGVAYTAAEVDVIVAYIVPEEIWYVIPVGALQGTTEIGFFPESTRRRSRFEKYREAWCWLACKTGRTGVEEKCGGRGGCPMK